MQPLRVLRVLRVMRALRVLWVIPVLRVLRTCDLCVTRCEHSVARRRSEAARAKVTRSLQAGPKACGLAATRGESDAWPDDAQLQPRCGCDEFDAAGWWAIEGCP